MHAVFAAGRAIGLLGLEPHTRRRNRANGVITRAEPGCLHIRVTESFGNCPKYIQVLLGRCTPRCRRSSSSPYSQARMQIGMQAVKARSTLASYRQVGPFNQVTWTLRHHSDTSMTTSHNGAALHGTGV